MQYRFPSRVNYILLVYNLSFEATKLPIFFKKKRINVTEPLGATNKHFGGRPSNILKPSLLPN